MTRNRTIFETVRPWLDGQGFTPDRIAALDAAIAGDAPTATPTDRFTACLPLILKHEGGYADHPKDPGGATNKGITQKTYDSWRDRKGQFRRSVRQIDSDEVAAIYRRDYWDAIKGDDLPAGIDYSVFDFAVNSGIDRASRYLQATVGVTQDGKIGPATITAANARNAKVAIEAICDSRMAFLRGLNHWPTFGKGWTARVNDVRDRALEMAA